MLRHLIAICLAALLVLSIVADRTSAKPPDLPDNEPIIVTSQEGTPIATPELNRLMVQSNDVSQYAPASPQIPLPYGSSRPEEPATITHPSKPEMIRAMPTLESGCPYRPCTAAVRQTISDAQVSGLPSVLDNLLALEKAACAIETAKKLGQAGKMTEALEQLDKARKLCPGSSMVRRADEVMHELSTEKTQAGTDEEQDEPLCPEDGCCCPMARINNCGMCWMARMCEFYEEVQKTACQCGRSNKGLPATVSLNFKDAPLLAVIHDLNNMQVPVTLDLAALQGRSISPHMPITLHVEQMPPMAALAILSRPLGLEPRICGESICLTSPAIPMCGPGVLTSTPEEACEPTATGESACPKCEQMHRLVRKKRSEKKALGVEEQVNGLMKACYLAIGDGRHARAADLAREAHALDPKRVEGDPLIYKLHLLGEKGQNEECEKDTCVEPTCPMSKDPVQEQNTGSVMSDIGINIGINTSSELACVIVLEDRSVSLRPALPAVDPGIVSALDAVLTTPTGQQGTPSEGTEESEEDFCCSTAKQVGWQVLNLFLDLDPANVETYFLKLGLSTTGEINFSSLSKYAGMKILVCYRSGIPVLFVQPADARGAVRQASSANE